MRVRAVPEPLRAFHALRLATIEFLRGRRLDLRLATYDRHMRVVAQAMTLPQVQLA
jgi:hypothetical protein